jgi:uncharacterized protein YutE (UPF0331/DUF86 family)
MNEIILNKKISIERCIHQINTYYSLDRGRQFKKDFLVQDAIAMNLQRLCELTIDIANHLVKINKLGLPKDSRESFSLLQQAELISIDQMKGLQAMVGFRNVLVHQYQQVDLGIMVDIVENHLSELLEFADKALKANT